MSDCIFCKILKGEIPSKKVYEDEYVYVFHDIAPMAPVHVLIIPREHIKSAAEITPGHAELLGHIWTVIPEIAKLVSLTDFRVVTNAGADAGQTVEHLHFHLLGGKKLNSSFA